MSRFEVDGFYREVAAVALSVAAKHGFVLGGGVAWVALGMVARPTEDVDLFADVDGAAAIAADEVRYALGTAGFDVQDEDPDSDLADMFEGFDLDLREFRVVRGDRSLKLTLGRLERLRTPILLDLGPVMHVDDLIASKVAALVNRREVRDYIDVAAVLDGRGVDELLALGRQHDPGLDIGDVAEAGRYLDRLSDSRFARYGLGEDQIRFVRQRLAGWPRP